MHDYNDAIKLATEVIAGHPSCYGAFHARAKANHAAGHLDEALHDLTEAVGVAPQNRELHKIMTEAVISHTKSDNQDSSSGHFSSIEGSTKI